MSNVQRRLIDEGFATVQQAARFLGCSKSRVYELVNGGVLSNAKLGGRIVIPRASLKMYAAKRLKLGSVA